MTINPIAAGGFSSAAATYARIRPAYPRPLIGRLVEISRELPSHGQVLDVGAGTGILTGQMVRAKLDCQAVEPLPAMAHQLRLALPSVLVVLGAAESLPYTDGPFGLLTVAQAFHWFDAPAALDEAARVLAPGGSLVLAWNVRDDSVPWVAALTDLVERRTGGRPYEDHREQSWEQVVAQSGRFGDVDSEWYPNPVTATRNGVLDRLRSTSFVAALAEPARNELLAEADEMLRTLPELSATFEYPHRTVSYRCRRL